LDPPTRRNVESNSSRREIAQLVRIRALLERDPRAAHRLAERSEREFPRGLLNEERRALAIVALAKSGAKQLAEQDAQRYFARYPHSPMRELIEAALRR
jgi:outer membrane protein assembly factor BamD (BamD/ComL family)